MFSFHKKDPRYMLAVYITYDWLWEISNIKKKWQKAEDNIEIMKKVQILFKKASTLKFLKKYNFKSISLKKRVIFLKERKTASDTCMLI